MINRDIMQDTIKPKTIVIQDSTKQLSDSIHFRTHVNADSGKTVRNKIYPVAGNSNFQDPISSCQRNVVADVNFNDPSNVIFKTDPGNLQHFPLVFISINKALQEETTNSLRPYLKSGEPMPASIFNYDWLLPFILITVFIYGFIRSELSGFLKAILKFFSFRGINESSSRDVGSLFQWQSAIFNLSAFINLGIFAFLAALKFQIVPADGLKINYFLITFLIVVSAVLSRHIICSITGSLSEEKEIFKEYLFWIYQTHRLISIVLLIICVLILYTVLLPASTLFNIGFVAVAFIYFLRLIRLFMIFITRNVSIFYLILYLCALEFLPVGVIVKYATGLV
jgi:hypothetical protein